MTKVQIYELILQFTREYDFFKSEYNQLLSFGGTHTLDILKKETKKTLAFIQCQIM